MSLDETHDPGRHSWIESANHADTDFPLQNLPFGVFSRRNDSHDRPRIGVAIGDQILDLSRCFDLELCEGDAEVAGRVCSEADDLNPLLALGPIHWTALRRRLHLLLAAGGPGDARSSIEQALIPMRDAAMHLPISVGDYTDFYCSIHHATNVGSMFRPDNPLMPNYKHLPVGYHGRASSVVVSGTSVRRPHGQLKNDDGPPVYAPSVRLDYELEVGFVVGQGNALGEPVSLRDAGDQIFGFCLVNDWSARDIQKWEYQPLGPFLGKSFLTSISPWIVTRDALAPFRVPAFERASDDPQPLPHLDSDEHRQTGGIDMKLEVLIRTEAMRNRGDAPQRLSHGNFRHMYWTAQQMLTHHASNGCNLRPGDLLASGTVSGPDKDNRGCLLELAWAGKEPLEIGGERRVFLQDGDEITLRGHCERDGAVRIGFGECTGVVEPALDR
ncbi:MAG: fumarylacetoacetase [Acidobacteriota bacterium]